ncbi:MAG: gamma carbonic anhydrase family protein [Alphaproteobacteria bacterium]|nr:gamma carbonic anhydrase family protein [Alphaproteobacteria bacterium]
MTQPPTGSVLPHRGIEPRLAADVFVAPGASVIGDVEIASGSSVWYQVVVRGDVNAIRIGANVNLQDGTVVHVSRKEGGRTVIGDDVTVGHLALIHACTLEPRCFVGMRATVMDGAVVETNAMVAAGALVTAGKRVRNGQLWAGFPAKYLRDLTPEEIAYNAATAAHYRRLADDHRQALAAGGVRTHAA